METLTGPVVTLYSMYMWFEVCNLVQLSNVSADYRGV